MGSQLTFLKIVCPSEEMDIDMVLTICPNLEKMEFWKGSINVWYDFRELLKKKNPLKALRFDD
ncbi:hypothetical protein PHMEG_00040528, partial [Phytophthora megakarya]